MSSIRHLIDLVESAGRTDLKAFMTTPEVVKMVRRIHSREEDFYDGDLQNRIYRFRTYRLRQLPVSALDLDEFEIDDSLVDDYAKQDGTDAPPIIYDPVGRSIIDGNHRANAASRRGDRYIWAYVGEDADPDWSDDDDDDLVVENEGRESGVGSLPMPLTQWRPHVMKPLAEHIPVPPDATNRWHIPDINSSWQPSAKLTTEAGIVSVFYLSGPPVINFVLGSDSNPSEPIGFVSLEQITSDMFMAKNAILAEDYRGKGVMTNVFHWIKDAGSFKIISDTHMTPDGVALWLALGRKTALKVIDLANRKTYAADDLNAPDPRDDKGQGLFSQSNPTGQRYFWLYENSFRAGCALTEERRRHGGDPLFPGTSYDGLGWMLYSDAEAGDP